MGADSAIDKDFHADHKDRYLRDKDHDSPHTASRTLVPGGGDYTGGTGPQRRLVTAPSTVA